MVIYTKPNCQPCRMTKRLAERLGIEFEEQPMTEENLAAFKARGFLAAPVVQGMSGTWSGFSPEALEAEAVYQRQQGRAA